MRKRAHAKPSKKTKRPSSPKPRLGTLAECCTALHLKPRRVQQLANEGLPKAARGRYNVRACQRWYIRYLQNKLIERSLMDSQGNLLPSAGAARSHLLTVEMELKQLDLARKRGLIVPIDQVTQNLASLVLQLKSRILSVPPRLAAELMGEKEIVLAEAKIERALTEALVPLGYFTVENIERAPRSNP